MDNDKAYILHILDEVDYKTIWDIVQNNLPELKEVLIKYE